MKTTLLSILLVGRGPDPGRRRQRRSEPVAGRIFETGVAESFAAGKAWFPFPAYEDRAGWAAPLRSRRRESHPAGRAAARLPMAAHPRQRLPRLRADGRPAGHGEARRGQPRRDDRPVPGRTGRREGTVHRPARQRRLAGRAAAFVGALGAARGGSEASGRFPTPANSSSTSHRGVTAPSSPSPITSSTGNSTNSTPPSRSPRRTPSGETSSTRTSIPDNSAPTGGWDWRPGDQCSTTGPRGAIRT